MNDSLASVLVLLDLTAACDTADPNILPEQGSRVQPILSQMGPKFSMVRIKTKS